MTKEDFYGAINSIRQYLCDHPKVSRVGGTSIDENKQTWNLQVGISEKSADHQGFTVDSAHLLIGTKVRAKSELVATVLGTMESSTIERGAVGTIKRFRPTKDCVVVEWKDDKCEMIVEAKDLELVDERLPDYPQADLCACGAVTYDRQCQDSWKHKQWETDCKRSNDKRWDGVEPIPCDTCKKFPDCLGCSFATTTELKRVEKDPRLKVIRKAFENMANPDGSTFTAGAQLLLDVIDGHYGS